MELQQGFVLTRHWRDTPAGTEVEFWLATDAGPRHLRLPYQTSVAFIPEQQRERAEALLRDEPGSSCGRWGCVIFSSARCWACTASSTAS